MIDLQSCESEDFTVVAEALKKQIDSLGATLKGKQYAIVFQINVLLEPPNIYRLSGSVLDERECNQFKALVKFIGARL